MSVISNWGEAIFTALANALNLLLAFIPRLLGFVLILLVGWFIATAISKAVTYLLRKIGFDRLGQRIGLQRFEQNMGVHMDAAGILGKIVFWFLFLIFLVAAADALGIPSISAILDRLVAYIPNVFVAILVLFLGALAATVVADLVRGATASAGVGNPNLYASIARYAIIGFAVIIALEQLQIAPALMNILFTAVVGAAALAFGLAFGLGGRDTARRLLDHTENKVSNAADQMQAQQTMSQAQQTGQMHVNAATNTTANPVTNPTTNQRTDRMNRPTPR